MTNAVGGIPADEVPVALVDVNGMAITVGHVAKSVRIDGDICRTQQGNGRWRFEFSAALSGTHVVLADPFRHLSSMPQRCSYYFGVYYSSPTIICNDHWR